MLIGGANEFQEYAAGYYGVKSDFTSKDMKLIAQENLQMKIEVEEEIRQLKAQSKPVHVCLTNAGSAVAYSMVHDIAQGDAIGKDAEIALHLFDEADKTEVMLGVEMEAFDLATTLLRQTLVTSDIKEAFTNCSAIVFLDELLQGEVETKDEWLRRNFELFSSYGQVINEVADQNVKVIVAGDGPVNLNASAIIQNAPNISPQNVVALARMVENQTKAVLSDRLKVNSAGVVDVIVWGNINGTNYVDTSKSRVHGYDGAIWGPPSFSLSAIEMVHDNKWLTTEFEELLANRKKEIRSAQNGVSSASQAAAVVTMMNHWWNGSPQGQIFSLGVSSQGKGPTTIFFFFLWRRVLKKHRHISLYQTKLFTKVKFQ